MRRIPVLVLMAGVCVAWTSGADEADGPRAVSPGSPVTASPLAVSCPTFSWSALDGATAYELVIYRVTENGELETALEVRAPRGATSWSPSATQCPHSGARYAWAVRALHGTGPGPWSEALLFETATRPSDDEVRRAVAVLRRYQERTEVEDSLGSESGEPQSRRAARGESGLQTRGLTPRSTMRAMPLASETLGALGYTRSVSGPSSLTLAIDGDFDLSGYIFKEGLPFIHTDGGAQYENTAVGLYALTNATPGASHPSDGSFNTAIGHSALLDNSTGRSNVAIGRRALKENTIGTDNTASGASALANNTTGSFNAGLGDFALANNTTGSSNTAVGTSAGFYWTTGSRNIAIGTGSLGVAGESQTIRIGGFNYQTKTFIEGIRGATAASPFDEAVCTNSQDQLGPCSLALSSRRFKESVREMENTSSSITELRPVTFRYRPEVSAGTKETQYGLIAEEVAEVFPTLVSYDEEGEPYTVRYELLTPLLLNEVQDLREEMVQRDRQMADRDRQVAELRRQVEKLARKKPFSRD